jgi:hypothetical protein
MTSAESSCSVCDEALEPHTAARCNFCGRPFHLNQRTDLPGKDCGDVAINEEHLGLEFVCANCQAELEPAEEALSEILDLIEVAAILGTDENTVIAAAESGYLRHRKLRPGVYLFEREAVLVFKRERR